VPNGVLTHRIRRLRHNTAADANAIAPDRQDPSFDLAAFCFLCCAVLLTTILRKGWVADDAYITFRTVDNWVHGYGMRWNPGERVETFTHPLWMLWLSAVYFVTQRFVTLHFIAITSSALFAVGAYYLAICRSTHRRRNIAGIALATLILLFSKAFVEYATSGLENALSAFLAACFTAVLFGDRDGPRRFRWLSFIAGLATLNRMDTALFFVPALASVWLSLPAKRKAILFALLGFSPFLAWEVFAITYYGFPFPNTAYAKLGAGIDGWTLFGQGYAYLIDSLRRDPISIAAVLFAVAVASSRRDARETAVGVGILLYFLYAMLIGGDFMSGRFFSVSVFLAAGIVLRHAFRAPTAAWAACLFALAIGATSPFTPFRENADAPNAKDVTNGIADERAYYYDSLGPLPDNGAAGIWPPRTSCLYKDGELERSRADARPDKTTRHVIACDLVGSVGLGAGPDVHIIDNYALCDPLLARIPARYDPQWRPGHLRRMIPPGYQRTLQTGTNVIENKALAEYYAKLSIITQGPIFRWRRLVEIAKINLGLYGHLIDCETYRYPNRVTFSLPEVTQSPPIGARRTDGRAKPFDNAGVAVSLGALSHAARVDLSLVGAERFIMQLYAKTVLIAEIDFIVPAYIDGGLSSTTARIPEIARQRGFDRFVILPAMGDGQYALGSVTLHN
jgi:arabinofuranosyltransferase